VDTISSPLVDPLIDPSGPKIFFLIGARKMKSQSFWYSPELNTRVDALGLRKFPTMGERERGLIVWIFFPAPLWRRLLEFGQQWAESSTQGLFIRHRFHCPSHHVFGPSPSRWPLPPLPPVCLFTSTEGLLALPTGCLAQLGPLKWLLGLFGCIWSVPTP